MTQPKVVLDEDDIRRTLVRIAHEIVEKNADGQVALVGIHRRGAHLARGCTGSSPSCSRPSPAAGDLDIAFYRDDIATREAPVVHATHLVPARGPHGRARRRRPLHRPHRARRRSRRCSTTGARRASSSPCWPTAATASCRSAPTTSARTSRPRRAERVNVRVAELDGADEVTITEPRGGPRMRHLLSIEDLDRAGIERILDRAALVHRGLRARGQEGPRAARPPRAQPLLRGVHAHALELRARRQVAQRRRRSTSPPPARASRRASRSRTPSRRSRAYQPDLIVVRTPHVGAAELVARWTPGRGRQRRRRQARAPDAGAARRLHAARAARRARRR